MSELPASNSRIRMNVSITAKGLAQWEVTSEQSSVDTAECELSNAIKAVRKVINDNGLKEVGGKE